MQSKLTVYAASAGSGKTFTLVKEYLTLALEPGLPFDKILAVTFTNDAVAEMKNRIIYTLHGISTNPESAAVAAMANALCEALGIKTTELQQRCKQLFLKMLCNYHQFYISTIDAFFLQLVRSFVLELNLSESLHPTLDPEPTYEAVALQLSEKIGVDEPLTDTLLEKTYELLAQNKSVNVLAMLQDTLKDLTTSQHKELINKNSLVIKELSNNYWQELLSTIKQYLHAESLILKQKVGELKNLLDSAQVSEEDYYRKSQNVLHKVFSPQFTNYDIDNPQEKSDIQLTDKNVESLFNKKSPAYAYFSQNPTELYSLLEAIEERQHVLNSHYLLFLNIKSQLHSLRLSTQALETFINYKKQHQIFFISDSEDLVQQLVQSADVPFIYEKVGKRLNYILIDEFQDTSATQWQNFKLLVEHCLAHGYQVILVGDPKQSIYGWRGGKVDLLVHQVKNDFEKYYEEKTLKKNNRSLEAIVKFNNIFFPIAIDYYAQRLWSFFENTNRHHDLNKLIEDGSKYLKEVFKDVQQEVVKTAQKEGATGYVNIEIYPQNTNESNEENNEASLPRLPQLLIEIQQRGYRPDDIALLIFQNNDIVDIKAQIETYLALHPEHADKLSIISGNAFLLQDALPIKLIIHALNAAVFENDAFEFASFVHYLNTWQQCLEEAHITPLWSDSQSLLREIKHLPLQAAVDYIKTKLQLDALPQYFEYITQFSEVVYEFIEQHSKSIYDFIAWWSKHGAEQTLHGAQIIGKIRVLTVHKSKGLDFPVVVLPKAELELSPNFIKSTTLLVPAYRIARSIGIEVSFPYLLLKLKKELINTIYATEYIQYCIDYILEKLNTLYVAFTRAERELHLLFDVKKLAPTANKLLHTDLFLEEKLTTTQLISSEKIGHGLRLAVGAPAPKKAVEIGIENHDAIQLKPIPLSKKIFEFKPVDSMLETIYSVGTDFHAQMAKILLWMQMHDMHTSHITSHSLRHIPIPISESVLKCFSNTGFCSLISSAMEWWIERELISTDGQLLRPDLVVIKSKDHAVVIDFKTGKPSDLHKQQVSNYKKVIMGIGYQQVEGYLMYLSVEPLQEPELTKLVITE